MDLEPVPGHGDQRVAVDVPGDDRGEGAVAVQGGGELVGDRTDPVEGRRRTRAHPLEAGAAYSGDLTGRAVGGARGREPSACGRELLGHLVRTYGVVGIPGVGV